MVHLSDIDRAIRQRALLRGVGVDEVVSPSERRRSEFLYAVSDSLLQDRQLLSVGERLELIPSETDVAAALESHPDLSRLTLMAPPARAQLLSQYDLGEADIAHLVITEIVHERWLDLVSDRVTEEQLRREYIERNTTRTVRVIQVPNIPDNQDVANFLQSPPTVDWFDTYYRDHLSSYRLPASRDVRIVGVRVANDASEAQREEARQRITQLRERVLAGEDMVSMSIDESDHPVATRGGVQLRAVTRQLRVAFEIEVGEVGPVTEDDFGLAFHRAEAAYEAEHRPLDDTLKREIAAIHLGRTEPQPGPSAVAARLLDALRVGDEGAISALAAEHLTTSEVIGPMTRDPAFMVVGVGTSEELHNEIFSLTADRPAASRVFLVGGRLCAVALQDASNPGEAEFLEARDTFEEYYRGLVRRSAWDVYWNAELENNPVHFQAPSGYPEDTKDP